MPVDVPSFADLYAAYRSAVQARDPRLTDFEPGSVNDALAGGAVTVADSVVRTALQGFRATFLALARGTDLDAKVADLGGSARKAPTSATTTLDLAWTALGAPYDIDIGDQVTGQTPDGLTATFEATEALTLAAGSGAATLDVQASATGRDTNVEAGTLDTLVGAPSAVTVTQASRAAGGSDGEPYTREGDAAYRSRYRLEAAARSSRGTVDALVAGSLTVDGVEFATVDESFIACDDGGYVAVYIGDPDAESSSALIEDVEDTLIEWRAAGVEVRVFGSSRQEEAYTFDVVLRSDSGITEDDIKDAVIFYFDGLGPGESHFASRAETAIHEIDPDAVLSAQQSSPSIREVVPDNAQDALRVAEDGTGITVNLTYVEPGALGTGTGSPIP